MPNAVRFQKILKRSLSFLAVCSCLLFSSCQNLSTRHDIKESSGSAMDSGNKSNNETMAKTPEIPAPPAVVQSSEPAKPFDRIKVGVILGPGGLRSFAHVGVLQELQKARLDIQAVVGFEMGALVGALYSQKAQLYDVEWQMQKLKPEDVHKKSLLGSSAEISDIQTMDSYLKSVFNSNRTESFKVPFSCPSLNLGKQQIYNMNRGETANMLKFCLPYPPLFKPYQGNVAGLTQMANAVKILKQKGANYFIYVSLVDTQNFPTFSSAEEMQAILWGTLAKDLESQYQQVHRVIQVPAGNMRLNDLEKRRDLITMGQAVGKAAAAEVVQQFGLN